ncbi:hypothetical protein Trydic_g21986 [Trypoxylus dichotomus]
MARKNKCKDRLIPRQDRRICGSICFCQLIVVFSSVSLIYLTVAIYIPSYRAFHSGFEEIPVMCQTINTSMINNCSWASCGEWCLTKTSGFCPQIQVTTRRNGTELQLQVYNTLYMANCKKIIATTMSHGKEVGTVISPKIIWRAKKGDILMMSCYKIIHIRNGFTTAINGTDCINGTIYNLTDIPKPSMNFTTFWSLHNKWREVLDPHQNFVPMQSHITIYNNSHLYINLDGCVNTLRGECRQFLQSHGKDGRNQTAQSRFHCFYNKETSSLVVARYDLNKTWKELIIAITIPTVLFVVSFLTLCVIMQSVKTCQLASLNTSFPNHSST